MKRGRVSVEKIISILKETEAGVSVAELCWKYGMTDATFYNWRKKYEGLDARMWFVSKSLKQRMRS